MMILKGINILRVSTVGFFVETQLKSQIKSLIDAGACVHVVTSDSHIEMGYSGYFYKKIKISRKIDFLNDLIAVFFLYKYIKKYEIKILHSTTPKAGLISSIAGFLARTPVRIHTFTGQVWVSKQGFTRWLFKLIDRFIIYLSTECHADGRSQVEFLAAELKIPYDKLKVIGNGSLSGIDFSRFSVDKINSGFEEIFRANNEIKASSKVITFIGRISCDKGVQDLLDAFVKISEIYDDVHLLLVGPMEIDLRQVSSYCMLKEKKLVTEVGYVSNPEIYMAFAYCLVLPSLREGFGTVVLEAAAMKVPAIVSDIYGLRDAVIENETALVCKVSNVDSLCNSLVAIISSDSCRSNLSLNCYKYVLANFDSAKVNESLINLYQESLTNA